MLRGRLSTRKSRPTGSVPPAGGLAKLTRGSVCVVAALALVLTATPHTAAQEVGQIAGSVTDGESAAALGGVQVFLRGTDIGTLTNDEGRFTLGDVPAGEYVLVARLIGYGEQTRSVMVEAGGRASVEIALARQAVGLEELVVTGQAGQARRREVGNSISQINVEDVEEPVANTEALLGGRSTGLMLSPSGGGAGAGAYIRLRGNVSVSQSNMPLIYIDGVRMHSDPLPSNNARGRGNASGVSPSVLNTLSPNDIERIEIIKGAAATTLYGTEAAAGVIQVFTKSGQESQGRPQWTFQTNQTVDHMFPYGPEEAPDHPYFGMEPWLYDGYGGEYILSARGGVSEGILFYTAGRYENNDDVLPLDNLEAGGIRGNLSYEGLENLTVQWNSSYNRQNIQNTPQTNSAAGIPLNVYRGELNYVGSDDPAALRGLLDYELTSDIGTLITGITGRWQATENMSHRLTLGYTSNEVEHRNLKPFGFLTDPQGVLQTQFWHGKTFTVDYAGSYEMELSDAITNTFSLGGQIVDEEERSVTGWAQGFPGPGRPTLSSGADQITDEARLRVINAGFFVQDRVGIADRLFVTGGLRVDGNSAFGENLGLEPYPKVSASYVLSDASWYPDSWGTLKLRGAWGQSGRAPGAFDAVKTWAPDRLGGDPAFLPENLGNPNLGPERTTEFEVGLDAALAQDRITAEFTYFNQRTREALFPVSQPPSSGLWGSQLANVGELKNHGIEVSLLGTVFQRSDFGWELGASFATNASETVDLGGATEFAVPEGPAFVIPGEPAPVVQGQIVTNPGEMAAPEYELHNYGPNMPTTTFSATTRFRFPANIVLSGLVEYQGGHYLHSRLEEGDVQRNVIWPACFDFYETVGQEPPFGADQSFEGVTALERSRCVPNEIQRDYFIYEGDFLKLRHVTVQLPMDFVLPFTLDPTLSLSARNIRLWAAMPYFDPEMSGQRGQSDPVRSIRDNIPVPATFTASLRFSF